MANLAIFYGKICQFLWQNLGFQMANFCDASYVVLAQCNNTLITFAVVLACLCLHHLSPYPKCDTNTPINQCKGIRELCLVRHSSFSVQFVRVLVLYSVDSILDPACIGLITPQSYYTLSSPLSRCPFQDKHKKESLHFKD